VSGFIPPPHHTDDAQLNALLFAHVARRQVAAPKALPRDRAALQSPSVRRERLHEQPHRKRVTVRRRDRTPWRGVVGRGGGLNRTKFSHVLSENSYNSSFTNRNNSVYN